MTISNIQPSPEAIARYHRSFVERTEQRRRENEQLRQRARQAVSQAVAAVVDRYPTVQRVYLFGSVTRLGAFKAGSDVDIGVEGATMARCFDIWRDLEEIVPEWPLDVRALEAQDPFSERVRQKGELVYERPVPTA